MNIFLLLLAVVSIYKIKFAGTSFFNDYMSKEQTTSINGIFVVFVFFRHFSQYCELGRGDALFKLVDGRLGQLIVVPFLFYSGYGIMVSLMRETDVYVKGFLFNRVFKVWYHFAMAIVLFIISNFIVGNTYSISRILLAFVGWTAIGNSNWYVFAVMCLYIIVYISFMIFKDKKLLGIIGTSLLSGVYILFCKYAGRDLWWYNTVLVFTAGMTYALFKVKIDSIVQKNNILYVLITTGSLLLCSVLFHFKEQLIIYEALGTMVTLSIIFITMKFFINNEVLTFLGRHTFEIYILQRIPMIIFDEYIDNRYILFVICFIITIIMAIGFKALTNKTDALIYRKENKR